MWMILCGLFIGAAALMMTFWDEAKPMEPHPWLLERQKVVALDKVRRLQKEARP